MKQIVEEIRRQFINEAINSPVLMADLAKMEQYISESYSGRSLIELLQNADDALATNFYIKIIDNSHAIIANNGRVFSKEDLYSLCRSGSSTKKRSGNTIGFRGIGFKSVVNYAEQVSLFSGDLNVIFSKKLTKNELPNLSDVPLIRIPHIINDFEYQNEIRNVFGMGYTTVFLFEMNNNILERELLEFDKTCLLFLRNISKINFLSSNKKQEFMTDKMINDNYKITTITDENDTQKWLSIGKLENSFAFQFEDNYVIDATNNNRVIHSFMPTKDRFCIPCKINGDFSTDPSRTKIVCDSETLKTVELCSEILADEVLTILKQRNDEFNLINVISHMDVNYIRNEGYLNVNDYFFDSFKEMVLANLKTKNVIIQPEWLDEETFLSVCNQEDLLISKSLVNKIPGLDKLLLKLSFKELSIEEVTYITNDKNMNLTTNGRISILTKIIDSTRFTMSNDFKSIIMNSYLFECSGETIKTVNLKNKVIDKEFYELLVDDLNDEQDFYWFAKKINITNSLPNADDEKNVENLEIIIEDDNVYDEKEDSVLIDSFEEKTFKKKSNYKKWRSVEQNIAEYFNTMDDVASVKDVSHMNVGYDIEVRYNDGKVLNVEVKSVKHLGDPFVMTNNEYSLANQKFESYALAVVSMAETEMEICIIKDPVNVLDLNRRIVRWEWVCNEYKGKYNKVNLDD